MACSSGEDSLPGDYSLGGGFREELKLKIQDLEDTETRKPGYYSLGGDKRFREINYLEDTEIKEFLLPIAKKWKLLGYEMGLSQNELSSIERESSSNKSRLITMVRNHGEYFGDRYQLAIVLSRIGEKEVSRSLHFMGGMLRPHEKEPLQLTVIKQKFASLLSASISALKHKPPQELLDMLSCFDNYFSALTKDCKDTDDFIAVLIDNATYLDYDLLQCIADAMTDEILEADSELYLHHLNNFLESMIHECKNTYFTIDKELCILPDNARAINQCKKIIRKKYKRKDVKIEFQDTPTRPKEPKGIEVIQEVKIKSTDNFNCFEWKGYGLKLKVPPLSSFRHFNLSDLTITIKASLSGHYQFPDGTELVSPVFWISCEPPCTFTLPVSLEIQHCALPENSHRLFMAKALCTQRDLPYSFKPLYGGTFNKHSSYGIIEMSSFSGVGVVQEKSEERRYWSSVFYMGPPNSKDIHFAVTWHSDAHITNLEKSYERRKAVTGPNQPLTFKDDIVTLDIPKEGINIEDGWTLYPATPPTITKKEIDDHHPESRTVPHCELLACWEKDERQMKSLRHTVNILGTTQENYFLIHINPGQTKSSAIEDAEGRASSTTQNKLEIRHLHNISECLKDLPRDDIIEVGLELGLHYPSLKRMKKLPHDMVEAWLQQKDGVEQQPTTEKLIQALQTSKFTGTADIVKTKFIHSL